jgi:hypothetical protein
MDRRKFLKIIPVGFLSSLLPAKLFGSEEKIAGRTSRKTKNEILHYQVDGVEIEQTTFFYTEDQLPSEKCHDFMMIKSKNINNSNSVDEYRNGWEGRTTIPEFFFDKNGEVIPIRKYEKNISKKFYTYYPSNAVLPKQEWINRQILEATRNMINWPHSGGPYKKVYVYLFLREDMPCIGICASDVPCTQCLLSYGPV